MEPRDEESSLPAPAYDGIEPSGSIYPIDVNPSSMLLVGVVGLEPTISQCPKLVPLPLGDTPMHVDLRTQTL